LRPEGGIRTPDSNRNNINEGTLAYGTQYKRLLPAGATGAGPVGAALPMRVRAASRQHFGSRTRDHPLIWSEERPSYGTHPETYFLT
jgi:hypothetical protein